jgi:hypothetical protein
VLGKGRLNERDGDGAGVVVWDCVWVKEWAFVVLLMGEDISL